MNPVVHFEMSAEDRKRMADFYTKVFGWKTQQLGEDMRNYILIYKDQHRAAKECGYASLLWLKSYYFSYLDRNTSTILTLAEFFSRKIVLSLK